jgi:putative FmdB family regulatory protein
MPIYEYVCSTCDEKFELRRGITDSDSEVKCPRCGAENPRRVISTFSTTSPGSSCAPGAST